MLSFTLNDLIVPEHYQNMLDIACLLILKHKFVLLRAILQLELDERPIFNLYCLHFRFRIVEEYIGGQFMIIRIILVF
jgi:small basic protein